MAVRIVHGATEGRFDFEGKTIEFVAKYLCHDFNIPHHAIALIGGVKVNYD